MRDQVRELEEALRAATTRAADAETRLGGPGAVRPEVRGSACSRCCCCAFCRSQAGVNPVDAQPFQGLHVTHMRLSCRARAMQELHAEQAASQ